jgi:hypothetical protein
MFDEYALRNSSSLAYDDTKPLVYDGYDDEYSIFSSPTFEKKNSYDYNMPPVFDDYGDENNYSVESAPATIVHCKLHACVLRKPPLLELLSSFRSHRVVTTEATRSFPSLLPLLSSLRKFPRMRSTLLHRDMLRLCFRPSLTSSGFLDLACMLLVSSQTSGCPPC